MNRSLKEDVREQHERTRRAMKVFVIAYACEPNRQSEPGVGWNIVGELARRHELTVLTRSNNRLAIDAFCRQNQESSWARIHWEYFDLPEWFRRLKKRMPCGIQIYQELWQRGAAKKYKSEFKNYDIVHHLTFGSVFFTPWAARHTGCLVWGPIGGASGAMERSFLASEDWRSRISEAFYRFVAWYSHHPALWALRCRKACRAILFRTSELAQSIRLEQNQETAIVGETAYAASILPRQRIEIRHPLRVMSVGRLIPLKGVRYAISAFAAFLEKGGEGCFDIYGDGPLRRSLHVFAMKLGVAEKVVFHGHVPNSEVQEALGRTDVLVHASFREGGSWTIVEAMAYGVPVICQDRAGMADMVTDECGTKVRAATPDELIDGFANALGVYYRNPGLVETHGLAGQRRVREHYSWKVCGEALDKIYAKVVEKDGNTGGGIETAARG